MARRKAYAGSPREHGQDARHHMKAVRMQARHVRAYLQTNRCSKAAEALVKLSAAEAQYVDARYYSVEGNARFKRRFSTWKTVDGLTRRFIQKCVR